jgi:hypothetical protein
MPIQHVVQGVYAADCHFGFLTMQSGFLFSGFLPVRECLCLESARGPPSRDAALRYINCADNYDIFPCSEPDPEGQKNGIIKRYSNG